MDDIQQIKSFFPKVVEFGMQMVDPEFQKNKWLPIRTPFHMSP